MYIYIYIYIYIYSNMCVCLCVCVHACVRVNLSEGYQIRIDALPTGIYIFVHLPWFGEVVNNTGGGLSGHSDWSFFT